MKKLPVFDSRKITPEAMFVAIRGTLTDGHNYIGKAIELGATTIVCEELPKFQQSGVEYIKVENSALALAYYAAEYYNNPSSKLRLVGVTGTNGKTTTATLLYELFTHLGYKVGLMSTVENRVAGRVSPSHHTTPDPVEINALLEQMVSVGCEYCFMEVSSHGLAQYRTNYLHFQGAIFTNITHDHLDYHHTFAEYLKVKKSFFDNLVEGSFALTNVDDKNGLVMLQNTKARKRTYSLQSMSDYHCRVQEALLDGMQIEINSQQLWVQFIGRFNAYNLTAIYGAAMELGAPSQEVLRILSELRPVVGRFECIHSDDGRLAIVDYAHTPDALENVLTTINELKGRAQIITVVGCGGDRDATKRPVMAAIAAKLSDRLVLTSDNPRNEEPNSILNQMAAGLDTMAMRHTLIIENRTQAIRTAAALAGKGDIILLAGKGHETYQEINGVRHHFDDKEQIREAFKSNLI
ncbi:MAG: UDP-N-acetylmuramoyl-L-alanyl-D-glutamate--2,6-diaminopimelate ligase [Mucinivorans sp.]